MSGKENELWAQIPSLDLEMDEDYGERVKAKDGRRHRRTDITTLKTVLDKDVASLPIRVATAANGVFDGLIMDLSASGCRVAIPKLLKKGELTKVGFTINQRVVISKAITRWISPKEYGCTAGLEFRGISADHKNFLGTISSASLFNKVGSVK